MRLSLAALLVAAALPLHAEQPWLTLQGDDTRPDVDTVQVNPESMAMAEDGIRVMHIRTSRGRDRQHGYDHKPYRSYHGLIEVDCLSQTASFRNIRYFAGPLWTGAQRVVGYAAGQRPMMVFREIEPNPSTRVITATCAVGRVTSADEERRAPAR